MSDTPETDAVAVIEGNWDTKALRMGDFARKLERERDVAREVTKNLSVALTAAIRSANVRQEEAEQAIAERDEWKEVAEGSLLGAIKERDMANALARAGKRVADICEEKMLEAESENLKLERERDALRNELNLTIRLSRTWEDDVKRISADRDYWRAEAERWQEVAK